MTKLIDDLYDDMVTTIYESLTMKKPASSRAAGGAAHR